MIEKKGEIMDCHAESKNGFSWNNREICETIEESLDKCCTGEGMKDEVVQSPSNQYEGRFKSRIKVKKMRC
jgi:hypothetical protein